MVLVGVLAAVAVVLVVSLRAATTSPPPLRFAFRTLLLGAIPAYIVMRGAAEWIASEEDVRRRTPPGSGSATSSPTPGC